MMQHQRKKCWKNKIVAEITLVITPRHPRLHTKGSFHHTKALVIAGNFFNSFIDSPRLNTTIYIGNSRDPLLLKLSSSK